MAGLKNVYWWRKPILFLILFVLGHSLMTSRAPRRIPPMEAIFQVPRLFWGIIPRQRALVIKAIFYVISSPFQDRSRRISRLSQGHAYQVQSDVAVWKPTLTKWLTYNLATKTHILWQRSYRQRPRVSTIYSTALKPPYSMTARSLPEIFQDILFGKTNISHW